MHRDKRLIAMSMMLPVFLDSVDQSILASALPTIGRDLGEVHNLPWLITAFLIAGQKAPNRRVFVPFTPEPNLRRMTAVGEGRAWPYDP
jgi:hypothetical protein